MNVQKSKKIINSQAAEIRRLRSELERCQKSRDEWVQRGLWAHSKYQEAESRLRYIRAHGYQPENKEEI